MLARWITDFLSSAVSGYQDLFESACLEWKRVLQLKGLQVGCLGEHTHPTIAEWAEQFGGPVGSSKIFEMSNDSVRKLGVSLTNQCVTLRLQLLRNCTASQCHQRKCPIYFVDSLIEDKVLLLEWLLKYKRSKLQFNYAKPSNRGNLVRSIKSNRSGHSAFYLRKDPQGDPRHKRLVNLPSILCKKEKKNKTKKKTNDFKNSSARVKTLYERKNNNKKKIIIKKVTRLTKNRCHN